MNNKDIRRQNLEALIKESGSIVALANKTETAPAYLSQLLNQAPSGNKSPRGMGDKTARKLEDRCGKPSGWMDNLHDESGGEYVYITSPHILRLLRVAEKAPPEVVAEHTRGIDSTTQLIEQAKGKNNGTK